MHPLKIAWIFHRVKTVLGGQSLEGLHQEGLLEREDETSRLHLSKGREEAVRKPERDGMWTLLSERRLCGLLSERTILGNQCRLLARENGASFESSQPEAVYDEDTQEDKHLQPHNRAPGRTVMPNDAVNDLHHIAYMYLSINPNSTSSAVDTLDTLDTHATQSLPLHRLNETPQKKTQIIVAHHAPNMLRGLTPDSQLMRRRCCGGSPCSSSSSQVDMRRGVIRGA